METKRKKFQCQNPENYKSKFLLVLVHTKIFAVRNNINVILILLCIANLISHDVFAQQILYGGGGKNDPNLTHKQKDLGTLNLACRSVLTKSF